VSGRKSRIGGEGNGGGRVVQPDGEPPVKLGRLGNYVGFYLRIAQDASFRAFARSLGQTDIKPGRFAALMVVARNPGIGQSALGRAIARDKSTVTPLIQDLQRRGLIDRRPSRSDRRRIHLFLTPAGKSYLARLSRHARGHDRKLDAIVGARKAEFIDLLKKIAYGLT